LNAVKESFVFVN